MIPSRTAATTSNTAALAAPTWSDTVILPLHPGPRSEAERPGEAVSITVDEIINNLVAIVGDERIWSGSQLGTRRGSLGPSRARRGAVPAGGPPGRRAGRGRA